MNIFLGLLIPFLGTTLGAGMVFLMKNKINEQVEKVLLGFASGVMVAASVWSLLIPSLDMANDMNIIQWLPATIGFILGIIFLILVISSSIFLPPINNCDVNLYLIFELFISNKSSIQLNQI